MSNTAGVRLAVNGKTDIGRVRDENEDAIRWHADATLPFGYVVIADGMGGYSGGSLASRIAVETFSQVLDGLITPIFLACTPDQQNLMIHSAIHNTINHANQSIIDAKHENPQFAHMGTTLVLAVVWQDQLVVAHVGDSRAYMWSTAGIVQITKDHSVVQDMIDAGALTEEQARVSNVRNHITRALGVTEDVEPTIQSLTLNKSSLLLLCSDGLSEYFDNSELEHVLATHRPALECCYRLIDEANQCGGKDNISVGILEFTANSTASPVVTDSVPTGSGEDTTVRRDRPIH